jgi:rod shape-determining protein MreC
VNAPYRQRALIGVAGGTARLMAYSLLAIALMALDYRGRYVDRVRDVATQWVEPLVLLIDLPFHGADRLSEFWTQRVELVDRLRRLERRDIEREAALGELADLAAENARLRALLDAAERLERRTLATELAAIDLDPFAHRLVVKRGRVDGVAVGMPVIDADGVLGQVEQTDRATSRVILLTDPDHALPVQILPSGERTIAYGSGRVDRLRLNDLPMNTLVQVGDLVVSSGLGGQFPPGLPVGRVVALERPGGEPFARAEVEPLAGMDRNRLVLILLSSPEPGENAAEDAGPPADEPPAAGADMDVDADAGAGPGDGEAGVEPRAQAEAQAQAEAEAQSQAQAADGGDR